MNEEDELLRKLDEEMQDRKVISLILREGQPVEVENGGLPADTVLATLFKALLFLVLDDYMDEDEILYEEED